jgi:hypothetical protein
MISTKRIATIYEEETKPAAILFDKEELNSYHEALPSILLNYQTLSILAEKKVLNINIYDKLYKYAESQMNDIAKLEPDMFAFKSGFAVIFNEVAKQIGILHLLQTNDCLKERCVEYLKTIESMALHPLLSRMATIEGWEFALNLFLTANF